MPDTIEVDVDVAYEREGEAISEISTTHTDTV